VNGGAQVASHSRAARWCGLGAVAGNALGVAFLWDVPDPYRPGNLSGWHQGLLAHPAAAMLSAWAFVVGLVLLATFMALVAAAARAERPGWLLAGSALVAGGALLDAAGCMAPVVALRFGAADAAGAAMGQGLLGLALLLDSAFNLLLGLGLVAVSLSLGSASGWPAWHRLLGLVAGIASLPLALQSVSDSAAKLLAVTGPLWLLWVAAAAVRRLWTREG
jgi:hypothetical protein